MSNIFFPPILSTYLTPSPLPSLSPHTSCTVGPFFCLFIPTSIFRTHALLLHNWQYSLSSFILLAFNHILQYTYSFFSLLSLSLLRHLFMALFLSLLLILMFPLSSKAQGPPSPGYWPSSRIGSIGFNQGFRNLWGPEHQNVDQGGLTIWLDKNSGLPWTFLVFIFHVFWKMMSFGILEEMFLNFTFVKMHCTLYFYKISFRLC